MCFKTLLVQVENSERSDRRVILASHIAKRFGASVVGVAAEPPYLSPTIELGYFNSEFVEQIREAVLRRLKEAKLRFEKNCHVAGSLWVQEEDFAENALAFHARATDLIIAARPDKARPGGTANVSDLVMRAGTPVLLIPDDINDIAFKTIVVAWKDTRECRRALRDAVPLLQKAEHVFLLHVEEGSPLFKRDDSLDDVKQRLKRLDIDVQIKHAADSGGSVADHLAEFSLQHGADLVVAGAYGHSRTREWVWGGVTASIVDTFPTAILLSH